MSFLDRRQQTLIVDLVLRSISKETFCQQYPVEADACVHLALEVMERALRERDRVAVECALYLLIVFPAEQETYVDVLLRALEEDWHGRHEDIAWELAQLKSPRSVDALARTALKRFRNGWWDDFNARARKCAFALQAVGTIEAVRALEGLLLKGNRILSRESRSRLVDLRMNAPSEQVRNEARAVLLAHRKFRK